MDGGGRLDKNAILPQQQKGEGGDLKIYDPTQYDAQSFLNDPPNNCNEAGHD